MPQSLLRYTNILSIVGDLIRVQVPNLTEGNAQANYGDLAMIEQDGQTYSMAQIIKIDHEEVLLQVFAGTKGCLPMQWSVSWENHEGDLLTKYTWSYI